MKAEQLRIGNCVDRLYQPGKFGIVIALETGGSVHLHNAEQPDDTRDITGIPLTPLLLQQLGLSYQLAINERSVHIEFSHGRADLTIDTAFAISIKYLHELQNLIFFLTGRELIDPYEFVQL